MTEKLKLINLLKGEIVLYKKGTHIIKCLGNYYNHTKWTDYELYNTPLSISSSVSYIHDVIFEITDPDMYLSPLYIIAIDGKISYSHIVELPLNVIYDAYHNILNLLLNCKIYMNNEVYNEKIMEYVSRDKSTDLELGEYIKNLSLITSDIRIEYNLNSDITIWLTNLEGRFAFVVKRIYVTGKDDKKILRVVLSNISGKLGVKLRDRNQFIYLTSMKNIIISNIINKLILTYENFKGNL